MPDKILVDFAKKLFDKGFNIIPIGEEKKPLTSWSSEKRLEKEELISVLKKAKGIAIVGGPINPLSSKNLALVLVDIDNPGILDNIPTLKSLIEKTVTWLTGPRCPLCNSKDLTIIKPGIIFYCKKCNIDFTIDKAKRGLGALFFIENGLIDSTKRFKDVEILVNNYQLIPPSIHPSGVQYSWLRPIDLSSQDFGIYTLSKEEFEKLLQELKPKEVKEEIKQEKPIETIVSLRELQDSEIIRIKELLKEAYKPGVRQYIWLFLSGWGAKAKISPISIARILKMLFDETQDNDDLKMRGSCILYSYNKYDIRVEKSQLKQILGVEPYGPESLSLEEIKGKMGIQEILEENLGEEKALDIIREIEDIFKTSSPFKDSILEILDYEKQLYAIANFRKLIVVRGRKVNDKITYKERIAIGCPTEVIVYINPLGGVTKYQVKWETSTRPRPITIGPCYLEEISDRLRAEGLVTNSRLLSDVLASLIEGYIRKGRALMKIEIDSSGFYVVDGKIIAVKYEIKPIDKEKLKESLLFLNELVEVWYSHIKEQFVYCIKWGASSPFSFIYKQKEKFIPWPYLYGFTETGKTTIGIIILSTWGINDIQHTKSGASLDSEARLGYILSQSTFPILVNEPGNIFEKEALIEILKNAIEKPIARGKYVKGSYVDILALAPLIFTSNKYLPNDSALLRRLKVIRFTYGQRISEEKKKEFEEKIKPRLSILKEIGNFIAYYTLNNGLLEDPIEHGRHVLEEAYRYVGLEIPSWLSIEHKEEFTIKDLLEENKEAIRNFLIERINEEFTKFVGKVVVEKDVRSEYYLRSETSLNDRIDIVLDKNLIPWLIKKDNDVLLTSSFSKELEDIIGEIGGLKSIAELLGWEYIHKYSMRRGKNVTCISVIRTSIDDFKDFLMPTFEELKEEPKESKQETKSQEVKAPSQELKKEDSCKESRKTYRCKCGAGPWLEYRIAKEHKSLLGPGHEIFEEGD